MSVDPYLEPFLDTATPFPSQIADWHAFREQEIGMSNMLIAQVAQSGPDVREKRTVTIPVTDGDIALNIYWPSTDGPHPAHLYFHGGGWIGGSIHSDAIDITCRERAVGADCVVVAVEYRKAPEHKFPAGLQDGYTALEWVAGHADELGIRADAITIGGASAGGNLAAAIALKARDESGPAIRFQLLEVPALDLTGQSESLQRNGSGYGLDTQSINILLSLYLPAPELDARNPYASPLLAEDLSDLPPALILSSEYDPIADDGQRYADRLNAADVPTTFHLGLGHIHISGAFTKVMPSARDWRDRAIDALRSANRDAIGE